MNSEKKHYLYSVSPANSSCESFLDYNEYAGAVHKDTLEASQLTEQDLKLYFRPDSNKIEDLIRSKLQIDNGVSLFLTAGADKAIEEVLQYHYVHSSVRNYHKFSKLTYDHFEVYCQKLNFVEAEFDDAHLVYICTPNNPDGSILTPEATATLIRENPHKKFIIDLTYVLYSKYRYSDYLTQLRNLTNYVFVSSFAKIFPIGGVRAGIFGSSNPLMNEHFNKFLNLKMVTPSVRRILTSCFNNFEFYLAQVDEIFKNRSQLASLMREFFNRNKIDCSISDLQSLGGNYICIHMPENSRHRAHELLASNGIIVRLKAHWPFIRITSVNDEGIARLYKRLLMSSQF